jgi:hypothetical protein
MVDKAQSDFAHHPVTTRLNSAKADDEEFVKPLDSPRRIGAD